MAGPKIDQNVLQAARLEGARKELYARQISDTSARAYAVLSEKANELLAAFQLSKIPLPYEGVTYGLIQAAVGLTKLCKGNKADAQKFLDAAWDSVQLVDKPPDDAAAPAPQPSSLVDAGGAPLKVQDPPPDSTDEQMTNANVDAVFNALNKKPT